MPADARDTIFDFARIMDRRPNNSVKWRRYDPDVLPLWVADMDFLSPPSVQHALQEQVAHGIFGYPEVPPGLKPAVQEWLAAHYDWQVPAEALVLVPGVVTGFHLASHALVAPEEAIAIQTPVYAPILHAAPTTGRQSRTMELSRGQDGHYSIDWDQFEQILTGNTRMFLLCNPHNPVGRVFNSQELEHIAELCLRQEVYLCSDEIHADLVYAPHRHIPIASLDPEIARRTITLIAPSKTFNIPGLGCSLAVIPDPELRERYNAARRGLVGYVNLMGMIAAEAAYLGGQAWLEQLLRYLQANRDFAVGFINHNLPGIRTAAPEGTYLAWLDCRAAGLADPYNFFLEQARVALNNGPDFGPGGSGFARLNFACPRATLEAALDRMQAALTARGSL